MKSFVIFLVLITSCISCNSDNDKPSEMVNVDTYVDIKIFNESAQDLLNPMTPHYFDKNNLKLFYLINGQNQEVFYQNQTYPRNFFIYDHSDSKIIRIFPNDSKDEEYPITYIKWNEIDTDTIKCHFNRGSRNDGSFIICDKVWYNDVLVFPNNESQNEGRLFEIIK